MLTDLKLRKLTPRPTVYRLADRQGLCIEVRPTGSLYWRYRYRFAGKATMLPLGPYPAVSLAEARAAHADAMRLLRDGKNPTAERRAEQRRRIDTRLHTFEAVARDWLALKAHDWTDLTAGRERWMLERHAFPLLGHLPITDITTVEVRRVLDILLQHNTIDTARRLRRNLSCVFRFAIAHQYCQSDPAQALADVLPAHRQRQYAHLTDQARLGELLRAIDGFTGQFATACALRLAPMLFLRPGELRGGEWSEIDLDAALWTIPARRMKLRKADKLDPATPSHRVPLSVQSVAILRDLHAFTGQGRFLFPGMRDRKRPLSNMTLNAALRRLGYENNMIQPHGFRHTASTALNEMGFSAAAIERQLAHKERGTKGVYDKSQQWPERVELMQAWADYLDRLREGTNGSPTQQRP